MIRENWQSALTNTVGLISLAIGVCLGAGPWALAAYGAVLIVIDQTVETYQHRKTLRQTAEYYLRAGEKKDG